MTIFAMQRKRGTVVRSTPDPLQASRLVFSSLLFLQSLVFVRVVSAAVSGSQKLSLYRHRLCRQRHKTSFRLKEEKKLFCVILSFIILKKNKKKLKFTLTNFMRNGVTTKEKVSDFIMWEDHEELKLEMIEEVFCYYS